MLELKKIYSCGNCDAFYSSEADAVHCCDAGAYEDIGYICPDCGEAYEDIAKYSAEHCCDDERELARLKATIKTQAARIEELESAGKKMRAFQKDYFRSRKHSDLVASKEFEKRFDETLNKPARTETQGSLV